jgi:DNA-binding HxlR family transcriptional regulator
MKKVDIKLIRRAERVFKGAANKNRLKILDYINRSNNTSVWIISQTLDISFKNTAQHLERLQRAGLINKHQAGKSVYHELTPYGEKVLDFVKNGLL